MPLWRRTPRCLLNTEGLFHGGDTIQNGLLNRHSERRATCHLLQEMQLHRGAGISNCLIYQEEFLIVRGSAVIFFAAISRRIILKIQAPDKP